MSHSPAKRSSPEASTAPLDESSASHAAKKARRAPDADALVPTVSTRVGLDIPAEWVTVRPEAFGDQRALHASTFLDKGLQRHNAKRYGYLNDLNDPMPKRFFQRRQTLECAIKYLKKAADQLAGGLVAFDSEDKDHRDVTDAIESIVDIGSAMRATANEMFGFGNPEREELRVVLTTPDLLRETMWAHAEWIKEMYVCAVESDEHGPPDVASEITAGFNLAWKELFGNLPCPGAALVAGDGAVIESLRARARARDALIA